MSSYLSQSYNFINLLKLCKNGRHFAEGDLNVVHKHHSSLMGQPYNSYKLQVPLNAIPLLYEISDIVLYAIIWLWYIQLNVWWNNLEFTCSRLINNCVYLYFVSIFGIRRVWYVAVPPTHERLKNIHNLQSQYETFHGFDLVFLTYVMPFIGTVTLQIGPA